MTDYTSTSKNPHVFCGNCNGWHYGPCPGEQHVYPGMTVNLRDPNIADLANAIRELADAIRLRMPTDNATPRKRSIP